MALPDAKVVGIEFDEAACATARAAGHHRILADMTELDPSDFAEADYMHASPPCQGFSMAGKGKGREDAERLLTAIGLAATNRERIPEIMERFEVGANDPRSVLTLEPLRWIAEIMPEYVTMEQVPTVLPIWQAYADTLRAWGYSAWADVLHAEQYGVPQTRKRAFLIARKGEHEISPPAPTHSRYYSRSPEKMDPGVLPWVSMAQALGWAEDIVMESNYGTGGDPKNRGQRTSDQPAPTMTSKAGRNKLYQRRNSGPGAERAPRPVDSPSYTIRAHGSGSHPSGVEWTHMGDVRMSRGTVRPVEAPAPTLTASMDNGNFRWEDRVNNQSGTEFDKEWPSKRPAPTVAGREIVTMPGANANRFNGATKSRNDGLRVTVQEAGILQSFRADYPWQGTKSKQFEQVGNAVPPLLMAAVVKELMWL